MSSFAYPNLSEVVPVSDMPAPASVDEAMPEPQTAPDQYLHALGQLLHDHQQQSQQQSQQAAQHAAPSANPYTLDNADNPYAVEPPKFSRPGATAGAADGAASGALPEAGAALAALI